ncbi:MAG: methylmalonyl-CoA epimerase [Elusimicrobia bacterium CG11_big_fil_rev_8_21_14_0_20_64_6]|nr:MAG: methylmalonyl-CoA epimerase [Elusimicrobia bacterium CG11_big_fil_rev_8_21_14_0_20_64_6]
MKLHHIGVAVKDLDEAIARHEKLGLRLVHREVVSSQQVEVAFVGERPWIELVAGTHPDSGVSQFIGKRGPGQHHLAFAVPSIAAELKSQEAAGARLIDKAARPGAWGHQVAFLHPKDQGGVLIELVEETQ